MFNILSPLSLPEWEFFGLNRVKLCWNNSVFLHVDTHTSKKPANFLAPTAAKWNKVKGESPSAGLRWRFGLPVRKEWGIKLPDTIDWPQLTPPSRQKRRGVYFLLALVAIVVLGSRTALSYWVDLLWFQSLGYGDVFGGRAACSGASLPALAWRRW